MSNLMTHQKNGVPYETTLIVIAKESVPGRVKTRLTPLYCATSREFP